MEKKVQARMDTDFLDRALADFSGYVAATSEPAEIRAVLVWTELLLGVNGATPLP